MDCNLLGADIKKILSVLETIFSILNNSLMYVENKKSLALKTKKKNNWKIWFLILLRWRTRIYFGWEHLLWNMTSRFNFGDKCYVVTFFDVGLKIVPENYSEIPTKPTIFSHIEFLTYSLHRTLFIHHTKNNHFVLSINFLEMLIFMREHAQQCCTHPKQQYSYSSTSSYK